MGLKSRHLTIAAELMKYFDIPEMQNVQVSYYFMGSGLLSSKGIVG
jgi:hypothetical protein